MIFFVHTLEPVDHIVGQLSAQGNMEAIQLLNTAIVKTKEKGIDESYEQRLKGVCDSPAIEVLNKAITNLSESQNVSRDQAASMIIETIRELDNIWSDYVMMEGIDRLKTILKDQ